MLSIFREGIPDPFLDLLGTSTGPQKAIFEQIKPFWNPQKFQNRVQNAFCRWWPPILSIIWHLGKILVTQGYLMIISGAKRPDSGQLGAPKGMICSQNGLLRAPKGVQISQIWSLIRTQWSLANWTILWYLKPILVMYKASRGAKIAPSVD